MLEYVYPVWGPQERNIDYLSDDLEVVEKQVTKIILSSKYDTCATTMLKIPTLRERIFPHMCTFGKSLLAGQKYSTLFLPLIGPKANI